VNASFVTIWQMAKYSIFDFIRIELIPFVCEDNLSFFTKISS